jgi:hypothetical protein
MLALLPLIVPVALAAPVALEPRQADCPPLTYVHLPGIASVASAASITRMIAGLPAQVQGCVALCLDK